MSTKILFIIGILTLQGCGIYSFTGASVPVGTETFEVGFFKNEAGNRPGSTFDPGLSQEFTLALQDLITNQTNLNLTNTDGDLIYEGEITRFSIEPTTATAEETAAQNRLTMTVNLKYTNVKNEDDNLDKSFSFFYDFGADLQLGDIRDEALGVIIERITQDIFNDTLAKW